MVVEMLQAGSDALLDIIAELFTDIIMQKGVPPAEWKCSFIKVLYKKGNGKLPENYRPIPILDKLLSRLIYGRIHKVLEQSQSPDQAGFRPGCSCDYNLFTIVFDH